MPDLQRRIEQIAELEDADARNLLRVIYNQLEIHKKDYADFDPNRLAREIRMLLDEYTE